MYTICAEMEEGGEGEREKKIRRKKTLINTLGLAGNVGGDEMCEG